MRETEPTASDDLKYAINALALETTRRLAHDRFITDKGLWEEFTQTDAYRRAYGQVASEPTVTELALRADTTTIRDAVVALLIPAANIAFNRKQGAAGHLTAEEDFARISEALDKALTMLRARQ